MGSSKPKSSAPNFAQRTRPHKNKVSPGQRRDVFFKTRFGGGVINDELDANDLKRAAFNEIFGAVAQFGQLEMRVTAEFQTGGDEDRVNLDAGGAGELKIQLGRLNPLSGTGQHPPAAGQQCSGQVAGQPLRFLGAESGELQAP